MVINDIQTEKEQKINSELFNLDVTPQHYEWKVTIAQHDWTSAVEESERGNQLRQASTLAILLPTEVRLQIIRATRAAHS